MHLLVAAAIISTQEARNAYKDSEMISNKTTTLLQKDTAPLKDVCMLSQMNVYIQIFNY